MCHWGLRRLIMTTMKDVSSPVDRKDEPLILESVDDNQAKVDLNEGIPISAEKSGRDLSNSKEERENLDDVNYVDEPLSTLCKTVDGNGESALVSEIDKSKDIEMEDLSEVGSELRTEETNTPSYHFDKFSLVAVCQKVFSSFNTFLKGCKWSPDGSCLLSNSDDNILRLFDLPFCLSNQKSLPFSFNYDDDDEKINKIEELNPSLSVPQTGLVYDYNWYPYMSSADPATSCFISTNSNSPVHLWDAYTGKIRASYRGFNDVDEITAAYCVAFNTAGDKIFCGYKNEVKMFDVSRPGRDCIRFRTKKLANQKGIISCVGDNPAMPSLFAAGSYRKSLGLYTVDNECVCLLLGHSRGLTQLKFSEDGVCLYSSARNDKEILCWDLRRPGTTLMTLVRPHTTNQRIYFDLSNNGQYLISGSTDGQVRIWDVKSSNKLKPEPIVTFNCSPDCVNGVSFHGELPVVATASGQRHFPDVNSDEDDSTIFNNMSTIENKIENSVKIWWVGAVD